MKGIQMVNACKSQIIQQWPWDVFTCGSFYVLGLPLGVFSPKKYNNTYFFAVLVQ